MLQSHISTTDRLLILSSKLITVIHIGGGAPRRNSAPDETYQLSCGCAVCYLLIIIQSVSITSSNVHYSSTATVLRECSHCGHDKTLSGRHSESGTAYKSWADSCHQIWSAIISNCKKIQWKWPEKYGEDKFVIMFGDCSLNWQLEDSGWLVRRKWVGRSLGASGHCLSRNSRFLLLSCACCVYTSRTSSYSCNIEHSAASRMQWLCKNSWQGSTIVIRWMVSKNNQTVSTIPVLESCIGTRGVHSDLCAFIEGSWLWCEVDSSPLTGHRNGFTGHTLTCWNNYR